MFVVLQWIVAAASFKMFFGRTKRGKSRYDALNVSSSPEDVLELEVSVPLSSPTCGDVSPLASLSAADEGDLMSPIGERALPSRTPESLSEGDEPPLQDVVTSSLEESEESSVSLGEKRPRDPSDALTQLLESQGLSLEQDDLHRRAKKVEAMLQIDLILCMFGRVAGKPMIQCMYCRKKYKWGDGVQKNHSTLMRHLKNHHFKEWGEACKLREACNRKPTKKAWEDLKSWRDKTLLKALEKEKRQRLNPISIKRTRGGDDKKKRNYAAIFSLVSCGIPFANLDKEHFKMLLKTFANCGCPAYSSCDQCSVIGGSSAGEKVDDIAAIVNQVLLKALQGVKFVSCTTDGWQDRQGRKYLSLTAHWISQDWELMTGVLGCEQLDVISATSEVIKETLNNIIDRYQRDLSFILTSMTSDSESSMIRAVVDVLNGASSDRESCFAHDLSLIIKDALSSTAIEARVRAVVSSIRSSKLAKELRRECLFLKHDTLVSPVDTRWSYFYMMLERMLELNSAIEKVLRRSGSKAGSPFTDIELEECQAWKDVLGIFEQVIRLAEGESYVTICHVPQWAHNILEDLKPKDSERASRARIRAKLLVSARSRLAKYLWVEECPGTQVEAYQQKRMWHESGVIAPWCVIAAALHPSHVDLRFLKKEQKALVWKRIEWEANDIVRITESSLHATSEEDEADDGEWEDHPGVPAMDVQINGFECRKLLRAASKASQDPNPLEFWKRASARHHALAQVARFTLAMPATSASSERVFSTCGFADRRAQGRSGRVGQLAFIKHNIHFLGETCDEQLKRLLELI